MNDSPFGTALGVYQRKRQEVSERSADLPASQRLAVRVGIALEPVVLLIYGDEEGREISPDHPFYFHDQHSFMGCTPDALSRERGARDMDVVVNAKTSTFQRRDEFGLDPDKFGREGTDELPRDYLWQAMQEMLVMGVDVAHYPTLFDSRTYRLYTVHRNDQMVESLIAAEAELAERIINADPPEPNWSHQTTKKVLQSMYQVEPGKVVELSEEGLRHWNERQRIKAEIAHLEGQERDHLNHVIEEVKDAQLARFPSGNKELNRVSVATTYVTQADIEALRKRLGEVKRKGHSYFRERKVKQ